MMASSTAKVTTSGHLLLKLRKLMRNSDSGPLSAYIVGSGDAHQSEYIAECDMRRQFISKFTGSAGTAIITLDKAALWTDGRYHLQASKELDPNYWTLMKDGLADTPTQSQWLRDVLQRDNLVGVDPFLLSHDNWSRLSKELRRSNIRLVAVNANLIDKLWTDKSILEFGEKLRPSAPCNRLIALSSDLTGKDWLAKVDSLRTEMEKQKAKFIVLTNLDDIAWLLNLRGSDIDYNPVFFAYCIVTETEVNLFVDKKKLTPEVDKAINARYDNVVTAQTDHSLAHVNILPYESVVDFIKAHRSPLMNQVIWISNNSSEALVSLIPKQDRCSLFSPVAKQKAIKNEIEIENMRNCHIRDAAALCEYLCWLEQTIEHNPNGHESLWEIQGASYLEECKKKHNRFVGLSFPSISASGPNGAVIHYHPSEETRRPISKNELYLIDCGTQYLDGTTDVTRTVHYGQPTALEREAFTRVLKGHIQIAMAVFPRLIKGSALDSFARQALWSQGLDYLHGTGHGVGAYLNVHEGPTSISPRQSPDDPGIEVGQILSNEPGYYENGAFGIRIESLVVAQKADTRFNFNDKGFLKFETITLVPIQAKLIDINLLTDDELHWLNEYHATCRKTVGQYLDSFFGSLEHVKQWINKETVKISRS